LKNRWPSLFTKGFSGSNKHGWLDDMVKKIRREEGTAKFLFAVPGANESEKSAASSFRNSHSLICDSTKANANTRR
jgi:hypothetical protein